MHVQDSHKGTVILLFSLEKMWAAFPGRWRNAGEKQNIPTQRQDSLFLCCETCDFNQRKVTCRHVVLCPKILASFFKAGNIITNCAFVRIKRREGTFLFKQSKENQVQAGDEAWSCDEYLIQTTKKIGMSIPYSNLDSPGLTQIGPPMWQAEADTELTLSASPATAVGQSNGPLDPSGGQKIQCFIK